MVAGHGQHRYMPQRKLCQKPVEQRAGRSRGDGGVVDVARQHHGLDAVLIAEGQDLLQNKALILQHIKPVDPFAKVQVSQVQKFHSVSPDFAFTALQGPDLTGPRPCGDGVLAGM